MDNRLLDILVCPICKGPLDYDKPGQELVCPRDRLAFPIRDDIPVMLQSEARNLDAPVLPAPAGRGDTGAPDGEPDPGARP